MIALNIPASAIRLRDWFSAGIVVALQDRLNTRIQATPINVFAAQSRNYAGKHAAQQVKRAVAIRQPVLWDAA
jgi:hypothetical protein